MINKHIFVAVSFCLFIIYIIIFTLISIIAIKSEKSIYLDSLGRGIGMQLIAENKGIVEAEKIPEHYKEVSKHLGYVLIIRAGHKIDKDNHGELPWAMYIQTKNNIWRNIFYNDISVLAVRDDLSVYELPRDKLDTVFLSWK
jgi:hypothetical protein